MKNCSIIREDLSLGNMKEKTSGRRTVIDPQPLKEIKDKMIVKEKICNT